jgi:mono/diheme cytochrome c family protein
MTFRLPLLSLALCAAFSVAHAQDAKAPYKVVDGYKVDANTMKGFRAWRAAACDRCHGANQEGMVGPSLIDSLKTLTKEQFVATVTQGRLEKGMPSFGQNPTVKDNIDALYAYLKGRSDGAITKAKVQPME